VSTESDHLKEENSMKPQLPIEVDAETGVWSTDGLPMLYVPRHFFTNNHMAIEAALGRARYASQLYDAGYKSAYFWCDQEAATHDLSGLAVYEHYLKRLSQRGWGRFAFESVDSETGHARITLQHSSFVLAQPQATDKLCYMFAGWFAGAMDWVGHNTGRRYQTVSSETQCAAEGHAHCVFTVAPIVDSKE
jgi:predicted hydrocarbon binding protein